LFLNVFGSSFALSGAVDGRDARYVRSRRRFKLLRHVLELERPVRVSRASRSVGSGFLAS